MANIIIAFIFTALIFGFFLYYYAWHNRHATQIRLAINKVDGRVISIERIVTETKKIQGHHQSPRNLFIKSMAWKVIYKDRNDNLCETRCNINDGQLYWHPRLS